jgi:phosphate transport system protein
MTRAAFDRQLSEIQEDMLVLAGMVESAIERGVQSLRERNLELAKQVIADDVKLNDKRRDIEERCLELIAMQQPLASDLRTIVSVLHITVDLERMGDHAEGIAKVTLMVADEAPLEPYVDIPKMAQLATAMLISSLEAFKDRDSARARAICDMDDEVDMLYDRVYRKLIEIMIEHPETIERGIHLTWVAHNLERIADRVTNICERVVYLVEGHILELNVSKY